MSDARFIPPRAALTPLSEHVFHSLARAIISGELPQGERISDESIARRFGVSRMPVREAFQRLERIGLIAVFANRKTLVTEITPQIVRTTLEYAGYQAGFATHAAVPLLTVDEREEAALLAEDAGRMIESPQEASERRRRLFSYLSERSGNPMHHAHMRDLEYAFERNLGGLAVSAEVAPIVQAEFTALAEAIRAGDRATAERIVRALHGL